jgi:hypothetical protein
MIDDRTDSDDGTYNSIKYVDVESFTKEGVRREALKVLTAESAFLKAANAARSAGEAAVSLEPEMKALAGGLVFVAKDVANLVADALLLVSKTLNAACKSVSSHTSPKT